MFQISFSKLIFSEANLKVNLKSDTVSLLRFSWENLFPVFVIFLLDCLGRQMGIDFGGKACVMVAHELLNHLQPNPISFMHCLSTHCVGCR